MERSLDASRFSMCLVGVALVILGLLLVRILLFAPRRSQDEPIHVRSKTYPVLGHMIGMLGGSNHYIEKLALETPHPIFRIHVLSRDLYLVNCPEVASAIYRNSKSLSFSVMIMGQMRRLLNLSSGVVLQTNLSGDPSLPELRVEYIHGVLGGIQAEGITVDLLPWLHSVMSNASAAALYGRDNPVAWDTGFLQTIHELDTDTFFLQNFGRNFMARKGGAAIDQISALFQEYYARNLVKNASGMISDRYTFFRQFWDPSTIARFEILVIGTIVTNIHILTFWMVVFIFGDPELLSSLRAELNALDLISTACDSTEEVLTINTASMLRRCPFLNSVWLETLRVSSSSISSRAVLSDTTLPGGHRLRKGARVIISAGAIHRSPAVWGPDAASFNPRRFLDEEALSGARKSALLPFGGGTAYCPGGHFVRDQVLCLVVALLVGFEVKEVGRQGLVIPEMGRSLSVEVMRPPVTGLRTDIRQRKGYENLKIDMEVPIADAAA